MERNRKKTGRMELVCSGGKRRWQRKAVSEEEGTPSLSVLPESLLLQIVSFLPVIDVIYLATVSKQWQHLWTMVPNLVFFEEEINDRNKEQADKEICFVDKALALHRSPKIDKLSLPLYEHMIALHVDQWIGHVIKSNVDNLELHSNSDCTRSRDELLELPEKVYTFSSLKKLRLSKFSVDPIGSISWNALTALSIDRIRLSNEVLEKILNGCPVLEFLKMDRVWGFDSLNLDSDSKSLKKLVLDGYNPYELDDNSWLTIYAPFLKSLTLRNCRKLPSLYVWSLVEASVDFDVRRLKHDRDCIMLQKLITGFFYDISHVENLNIHTDKVMSIWEMVRFPASLSNCKILTLHTGKLKWGIPALANLSQGVPNLETLVIKVTNAQRPRDVEFCKFCKADTALKNSDSSLDHLKLVKIHITVHQLNELDLDLVQFILKNAKALEKMVFYKQRCFRGQKASRRCCNSKKLLQGVEKLLSLPKASPNAVIMVE